MGYGDICLFWIEPVEISFTGDILINEFFPFYYYLGFQFLHSKRQTHSLSNAIGHLSNSFEVSVSAPAGKRISLDGLLRIVRG